MPPVIPAVIAGAAGVGAAAVAGATITFATFAVPFAITAAAGLVAGMLRPDAAAPIDDARNRQVSIRSAVAPHRIVYGRALIGGQISYFENTGPNNEYVHLITTLTGHEIDGVNRVYFDDVALPIALGNIVEGRFANVATVRIQTGSPNQEAIAELVAQSAGKWTTAHRQRGRASVYMRLKRDDTAYPYGVPAVRALVRGRQVYDPRSALTVWSDNPALCIRDYLTASFGRRIDASKIDDTLIIAAANVCDEWVDLGLGTLDKFSVNVAANTFNFAADEIRLDTGDRVRLTASSYPGPFAAATDYYVIKVDSKRFQLASTYDAALRGDALVLLTAGNAVTITSASQKRFTMNGSFTLDQRPFDIVQGMLSAMNGALVNTEGVYRLYAAAWTTPTISLTESDLRGPVQVKFNPSRQDLFNTVRGQYTSAQRQWQPTDFKPVANAAYITADGGNEIAATVDMPWSISEVRSQRLAKIHLERARQGELLTLPCNLRALRVPMWDVVQVTIAALGYSAKTFRVVGWRLALDGETLGVDLTLQAEDSTAYAWTGSEGSWRTPEPDLVLPGTRDVSVPGNPVVTESLYETLGSAGVKARATVTWSPSLDANVQSYELQYKRPTDTVWQPLPLTPGVQNVVDDVVAGMWQFRVRAINTVGAASEWATTTREILGLTAPPANVTGFSVRASGGLAYFTWDVSPDLDVRIGGRIVVRHASALSGAGWNDAVDISADDGFQGGVANGVGPLMSGTYFAKAKDSSGTWSNTAASFVVSEALAGYTLTATIAEHPAFAGTKSGTANVGGGVQLDGITLIDDVLDLIDSIGLIDSVGGGFRATGTYAFANGIDMGSVKHTRLTPTVQAQSFNAGDLWDARTALIDTWDDVQGDVVNDATVRLEVRSTDDNPAGAPTWSAWYLLQAGDLRARAFQFRAVYATDDPQHNVNVTQMTITAREPV